MHTLVNHILIDKANFGYIMCSVEINSDTHTKLFNRDNPIVALAHQKTKDALLEYDKVSGM